MGLSTDAELRRQKLSVLSHTWANQYSVMIASCRGEVASLVSWWTKSERQDDCNEISQSEALRCEFWLCSMTQSSLLLLKRERRRRVHTHHTRTADVTSDVDSHYDPELLWFKIYSHSFMTNQSSPCTLTLQCCELVQWLMDAKGDEMARCIILVLRTQPLTRWHLPLPDLSLGASAPDKLLICFWRKVTQASLP